MKNNLSTLVALMLTLAHAPAAPAAPGPRRQTPPARQQQQQQPAPRQTPSPQPEPQPPTTPQPSPTPADEPDEDVVRITSNLVQFDAVVTDKQGRLVTDLRPEDFEVLLDGKRQEVTNFSFVSSEPAGAAEGPAARPDNDAPRVPPALVRPGQVRRTIALVVDDLGTSFEDIIYVRRALKKFVDEQMQPGDLVAIMRTSAGVGALQQFTTDKRILHRAVERVRWNPSGRAGVSSFAPIEQGQMGEEGAGAAGVAGGNRGEQDADNADVLDAFRESVFTVGTLGALNFIIRGMRELPGRKSVLVFSGGFAIYRNLRNLGDDTRDTSRILENLRRLTDAANRASVVIYTMDARGLPTLGLTAADRVGGSPQDLTRALDARRDEHLGNQEGLAFLAQQTGGIFIRNTNDLGGGVRRVLDDQKGYYLIGFRPGGDVFEPQKGRTRFNKFEVKVRREGLRVRTRAGFYGYAENDRRAAAAGPRTRSQQMVAAIASPLTSGELTLRLTSLFNSPASKAEVVDSLLHIDLSQFKLSDEPDGWKKAVIDVVAVTFGEDGQVVDEINRTETVRMRDDGLRQALSEGLVYLMKVPIKKPGAYQLRVAVRDAATARVGSASQFIEVPDLKKNRLALSGIFMIEAPATPTAVPAPTPDPVRDAALRRFRQGAVVDFIYHIYNARVERAGGRPQLQTQTSIFRDGQPVFSGSVQPYNGEGERDMTRLRAGSRLQLGGAFPPGEYVLQVVVTDTLAKGKSRTVTQWIDFEVVK